MPAQFQRLPAQRPWGWFWTWVMDQRHTSVRCGQVSVLGARRGSREGVCPRAWCARVRTVAHWWRTGGGGGEAGQAVHRGGAGAQRPQGGNHRGGRRMGACFMPLFLQSPPPTTCHRHISHSLRRHLLTLTAMHWRRTANSILMPHWLARRFKRVLAGAGSRQCCE